jgi:lipid II:glycine glycyltransferase (peptidoglycan interpeptide bridge formation enzyme)
MDLFEQGLPNETWDARQRSLGGHMLQGRPWAQFQQAVGRQIVWAEGEGWSWLGVVTQGRGVTYLYAPYGPTVSSATSLDAALESLRSAASQLKLDFVRLEPVGVGDGVVVTRGLRRVKLVQPQHSLIVDLTQDEAELRAALSSSQRNTINGAERRGLVMRASTDISDLQLFLDLTHATAKDRRFTPHPDSYYRTMLETLLPIGAAKLFVAEYEGKAVSVSITLDYEGTRGYAHTGNDPEARKLRATAPLVWAMMLDAKASGLERFDLWGIAPEGASKDHPWAGFTEFKRAFGGTEIAYSGTWELPLRKAKYGLYRLAKKAIG